MNIAKQERFLTAHSAFLYASARVDGGDLSGEAVMGEIKATNRLLDCCIEAGMAYDHSDLGGWAAIKAAEILCN